jgi:hypothetical protein
MNTIVVICLLHCCTTITSPTKEWNENDQRTLKTAQNYCKKKGECLISLKKVEESVFTALCGKENN